MTRATQNGLTLVAGLLIFCVATAILVRPVTETTVGLMLESRETAPEMITIGTGQCQVTVHREALLDLLDMGIRDWVDACQRGEK